jgi:hypothetical protein
MADAPGGAAAWLAELGGGGLLAWAALPLALYLVFCLALLLLQRSLLYFPQPRTAVPGVELLRLPLADAAGALNISTAQRQGSGAVLYFGGNAEDVALTVPSLAAIFPERSIQAVHYRGYGGSGGRPTERSLHADAAAVFDDVRSRHPDVDVLGRSLGSAVATRLAATKPVRRLVLVTPFDSILALAGRLFPFLPVRLLLADRFETVQDAPQVPVPTLVITAGRDEVGPGDHTRRLIEAFRPGIVTEQTFPAAGHNDVSLDPAYRDAIRTFLD